MSRNIGRPAKEPLEPWPSNNSARYHIFNVFKDLAPRRPGSPWGIDRIVGGHAADPYTWQWIVHFKIGCGGSIIHPNFVVTAGHCCFSTNPQAGTKTFRWPTTKT